MEGIKRYKEALRDLSRKLFFKDWKTGDRYPEGSGIFVFSTKFRLTRGSFEATLRKKISMPYYNIMFVIYDYSTYMTYDRLCLGTGIIQQLLNEV